MAYLTTLHEDVHERRNASQHQSHADPLLRTKLGLIITQRRPYLTHIRRIHDSHLRAHPLFVHAIHFPGHNKYAQSLTDRHRQDRHRPNLQSVIRHLSVRFLTVRARIEGAAGTIPIRYISTQRICQAFSVRLTVVKPDPILTRLKRKHVETLSDYSWMKARSVPRIRIQNTNTSAWSRSPIDVNCRQ